MAIARSRAPTVFLVRIETIRTKNTVPDKDNNGFGLLLSEVVDCARMGFHPCAIGDPRGRLFVRAKSKLSKTGYISLSPIRVPAPALAMSGRFP
jgi:hypothetical protein